MLVQLLYVSRSNLPDAPEDAETEVTRILSSAYLNNRQRGVTGILFHCGPHFAQILEGPEKGVQGAMSLIERDNRHRDIRILFKKQIEEPSLPSAAMGCAGLGPRCPEDIVAALEAADAAAGIVITDYLLERAREGDLDLPPVAADYGHNR